MDASNSGGAFGEFQLNGDTLTNAAAKTTNFTGTGNLDIGNGGAFINNGTFVAQNNQMIEGNLGGSGNAFYNNGTFTRSTRTGGFTVSVAFDNAGAINVQTGTLSLEGGGTGSGLFVIGSGAILQFTGNYTLANPSSFSGAGLVDFNGATLTGTTNFNSTLTLSGPGTWAGGVLTFPTGGVTMDASNSAGGFGEFQLNQDTLSIAAGKTVTFIGTKGFDMFSGATVINSGTFLAENNQYIDNAYNNGSTFNNNGVFIRNTGTGTFAITGVTFNNAGTMDQQTGSTTVSGAAFNNTGTVNVLGGTLSLQDGGSASGGFAVSSGAVLQFVGGTAYSLSGTSGITGTGMVDFNGGVLSGTGTFNSTLTLSGLRDIVRRPADLLRCGRHPWTRATAAAPLVNSS